MYKCKGYAYILYARNGTPYRVILLARRLTAYCLMLLGMVRPM